LMLPRRQRFRRLGEEMLHPGKIVAIFQPAVLGVEAPAADVPALGLVTAQGSIQNPLTTTVWTGASSG
jgi:hypothetical protein